MVTNLQPCKNPVINSLHVCKVEKSDRKKRTKIRTKRMAALYDCSILNEHLAGDTPVLNFSQKRPLPRQ